MSGGPVPPELLESFLRAVAGMLAADMLAEGEATQGVIRPEDASGKPPGVIPGRMDTDFSGISLDVIHNPV